MSRDSQPRTTGFWRGVVTGLLFAVIGVIGLALIFPPHLLLPPDLAPDSLTAPPVPSEPGDVATGPRQPRDAGPLLTPPTGAPIIATGPVADPPPMLEHLAPPPAPDVFVGGAAGSPSLVPPSAE